MDVKLVEKARKLFSMSKSKANENEAMVAAEKLNKLRLENNLSRLEFKNLIDNRVQYISEDIIEKIVFKSKNKVWWRIYLIGGVADFNSCDYIIRTKYNSIEYTIIGTSTNVELAEIQLNYLVWVLDQLSKNEVGRAAKNSFRVGFSNRVKYRLLGEKVKREKDIGNNNLEISISNEQREGLVLMQKQEDNDLRLYMSENYPNLKTLNRKQSLSDIDAYARGQHQGQKVGLNPRQLRS
jgi:hypothetical protein